MTAGIGRAFIDTQVAVGLANARAPSRLSKLINSSKRVDAVALNPSDSDQDIGPSERHTKDLCRVGADLQQTKRSILIVSAEI